MSDDSRFHIMDHPLIRHKLTLLRKVTTTTREFRQLAREITHLIGYEATRQMELRQVEIETPLMKMQGEFLQQEVCLVPILRAGLGLVDAMLLLMPNASVGHIGLSRDPATLVPVEYYCKVPPDLGNKLVIVLDPMLATGGSAVAAVSSLKERGAKNIIMINLLGVPEGVAAFGKAHPDVHVFLGSLDKCLNDRGYILPGLGDAGDRLFGTL